MEASFLSVREAKRARYMDNALPTPKVTSSMGVTNRINNTVHETVRPTKEYPSENENKNTVNMSKYL